jgi:signal transduction histidine kinase
VAARRRVPFGAAIVSIIGLVAYQISTKDPDGSFIVPAILLVYYYVGRSAARRQAWTPLALLLGYALVANVVIEAGTGPFSILAALATWPIMVVPVAAGILVERQAALMRRLTEATASLRDEQRVRADRMLGEERNRVARELHDVVAHHVSVMVIQAGAARLVATRDQATADIALGVVERSGRDALADLRRIMGAMRRGDAADAGPSAGLEHLDQLADRARASGVQVEVRVNGRIDHVPTAVDLVAYRVVQEALTNVVKHARAASSCVVIDVGRQRLDVTVTDDGANSIGPAVPGSRHGLIGMRERVALYGGELTSGRRAAGGFEVHAAIPLRAEPLAHQEPEPPANPADRPRWMRAVTRWVAAIRPRSDLLFAIGWLGALEVDVFVDRYRRGPLLLNLVVVAAMAIVYVWRRRVPLAYALAVGSAAIPLSSGLTSAHSTLVGFYCVTVPMFTVAAWDARPRAVIGLVLWLAGSTISGLVWHKPVAGVAGGLIMSCLLWVAGRLWRRQCTLTARLAEAHLLLAAEREDRERLAIASERARIARELHALVAQGVVAMIVQAAAARGAIRDDPDVALAAIRAIERTGREALARMRDILGVLRAPQESRPVGPQPGLGQLHALIQRLRDGGRTVSLRVEGDPGPLPAGVDLTTYRIIEAALAVADPRPSREVTVVLRFGDDGIEVDLAGSGLHLPPQLRLTVRERAALCNGAVLPRTDAGTAPQLVVRLPFSVPEAVPV